MDISYICILKESSLTKTEEFLGYESTIYSFHVGTNLGSYSYKPIQCFLTVKEHSFCRVPTHSLIGNILAMKLLIKYSAITKFGRTPTTSAQHCFLRK